MTTPTLTFQEHGVLPIGIKVDGQVHRDFTLRPRLVRDSVQVLEDPKAQTNDAYRGVALMACQVVQLGTLNAEQIDTELLLSMFDTDMATIMEAASRLEGRLMTFRDDGQAAAAVAPGAGEDRRAVARRA